MLRLATLNMNTGHGARQGTPETIEPYHTYPAVDPDRTLDYVFVTRPLSLRAYRVVPRPLSDHLAVMAEIAVEDGAQPG